MADVLLIGEPMGIFTATDYGNLTDVDLYKRGVSGAEANVSIGLARLAIDVDFVTRVGDDPFGQYIVEYLKEENVGINFINFDEVHRTGLQLKEKIEKGDPKTAYFRKNTAFQKLTLDHIEEIDFSNIDLVHVTGIPPAVSSSVREATFYLIKKAKEEDCLITFDPNIRESLWESETAMKFVLNELAAHSDIILPGIDEGKMLTGYNFPEEIADYYLELGAKGVVIKTGSEGAFVKEKNGELKNIPGYKVENIVDTVGAGDGFSVGIISGYLDGLTLEEAADRGNAIGSIQIQHPGDNDGLPDQNQLEEYMQNNKPSEIGEDESVNE